MKKIFSLLILVSGFIFALEYGDNVYAGSVTITTSGSGHTYGNSTACAKYKGKKCTVHAFTVSHDGKNYDALCATPSYGTPSSPQNYSEETDTAIKKIMLVSPVGPLYSKYTNWSSSYTYNGSNINTSSYFSDNYARASVLLNYTKKMLPNGSYYGDGDENQRKGKYPGFWNVHSAASDLYTDWQTKINTFFNDSCYRKYVTTTKIKIYRTSSYSSSGSTGQSLIWVEKDSDASESTICQTETTASFSVVANVTDGTTAKTANNSTSASPYTYAKANNFSSFNLTFGGEISRSATSTYNNAVTINSGIGASTPTLLPSSVSLSSSTTSGSSASTVVAVSPGTTTSSDTNGNSVTVAPGETTPNICRTVKISPTSYSSTSGGSGNATSTVCVRVSRAAPPADTYDYARFTGSVTSLTDLSGKMSCSGDTCYVNPGSGSANVKITGSVTRKNDATDTHSGSVASRYALNNTSSNSLTNSSGKTSDLAKGGSATGLTGEMSVNWNLAAGDTEGTFCGYIHYDSVVTYKNGSEDSRTEDNAYKCITIKAYSNSNATFSGATSITSVDPALTCTDDGNTKKCRGLPSQGSYSVTFNNTVSRTDTTSAISSAGFRYQVNKNGTNDTAKSGYLAVGGTKTNDGLGTNTVSVSVPGSDSADQTKKYCQKVNYNSTTVYNNGNPVTPIDSLTMNTSSTEKCIEITRPKNELTSASFSGSISVTDNSGALVYQSDSGNTLKYEGPSTTTSFSLTFKYKITRGSSDSYIYSASSRYGTYLLEETYNDSRFPLTKSSTSNSLARGGSQDVRTTTQTYTVNPGETRTVCAYMSYDSSISYRNGSEYGTRGNTNTYKCIEIYNPDPSTVVNFSGSTSDPVPVDSSYFETKNGAYYVIVNSSNNKYRVRFSYTIARENVNLAPWVTTNVRNNYYAISGGATVSGTSGYDTFGVGVSKTKTNQQEIYLPPGTSKTICQKLNYNNTVTIRYSDQAIVGSTTTNTPEKCITFKNPIYEYKWDDTSYRNIDLSVSTGLENITNASGSGTNYVTLNTNNPVITAQHTVSRKNDAFGSLVGDKVRPLYTGNIKENTASSWTSISGQVPAASALWPNQSWTTSASTNTSSVSSGVSIKAGKSKTVCSYAVTTPGGYRIKFGTQYWRETYTDGTPTTSWVVYRSDRVNVRVPSNETIANSTSYDAPKSNPSLPTLTGSQFCLSISRPYNYKIEGIVPVSDPDPSNYPDETLTPTFTFDVTPNDPTKEYTTDLDPSTQVKIITYVVDKDTPKSSVNGIDGASGINASTICPYFRNIKTGSCTEENGSTSDLSSHIGDASTGGNYYNKSGYSESYGVEKQIPGNLEVGDKFCITIAISPLSSSDSRWILAKSFCSIVSKKPTVQIWGGSVLARGGINTSNSTKGTGSSKLYYGSWSDFALISGGKINKMASGAALSGGRSSSSFSLCGYSPLTFSNAKCSNVNGTLGESSQGRDTTGYFSRLKEKLDLDSSNITYVDGNLTITEDMANATINSSASYGSANINQTVFIATGNVYIEADVERIDAWIVAQRNVYTCDHHMPTDADFSADICRNKLTINGPVIANKIYFNRTAGGDSSSLEEPAELINLTPAAFLWSYTQAIKDTSPQTTYLRKLSPRY